MITCGRGNFRMGPKTGTTRNPCENSQLIHDTPRFQNPPISFICRKKSTISALFKAKSVDPKTYSPPPVCCVHVAI